MKYCFVIQRFAGALLTSFISAVIDEEQCFVRKNRDKNCIRIKVKPGCFLTGRSAGYLKYCAKRDFWLIDCTKKDFFSIIDP